MDTFKAQCECVCEWLCVVCCVLYVFPLKPIFYWPKTHLLSPTLELQRAQTYLPCGQPDAGRKTDKCV